MTTAARKENKNLPTVVLVGRVNVGKSTLFNRLLEENKAIVSDVPGTTRTNNEGDILWRGRYFHLIDTGGLTFVDDVPFEKDIIAQTEQAMKKADLVVMVSDARTGIQPQERTLARRVLQSRKPAMLVANKVDTNAQEISMHDSEWRQLGLGDAFPISGANGRNLGEFLDKIFQELQTASTLRPKSKTESKIPTMRVSIIGKPNVGKSSLFNKLIGEEKVIVSPIAHTTREPHDTLMTYTHTDGKKKIDQPILFVDTAGIRRKANVTGQLEKIGVSKSILSMQSSDIILLVLDGSESFSSQDLQLGGMIERHAKSVIILVNKWDLATDNSDHKRNEVKKMVYSYFPHLDFAPILFVSGKSGYRAHQIFETLIEVWNARHKMIKEDELRTFLKHATYDHRPSRGKGTRHPELTGMRQIDINPPVFELYVKYRTSIHSSYLNYLERKLRETFNFFGTPIILKLTKLKR
jgi:GTP-binding protein